MNKPRITRHDFAESEQLPDSAVGPRESILRVCAVDPGVTTGIAYRDDSGATWTDEAKSSEDVCDEILKFRPKVIIVERFATSGRMSGYGLQTIELVGRLAGMAQACTGLTGEAMTIHVQYPQYRTSMQDKAQNHSAPSLHGRRTHKGRHEADALAHLLAYMWHTEKRREEEWYK